MLFLLVLFLFLPWVLHAYLDPGTGTILVNLLIAGLATLVYSLKGFILRLLGKGAYIPRDQGGIAIFSEGRQYWATFEPIILAFLDRKISFRYYTLDVEDEALLIENELMSSRFLGYGSLAFRRASNLKADYLISTTPNLGCNSYPISRSSKVGTLVHVFHSINDLSMYRIGSLDHYDLVIMVGEFQAESIRLLEKKRNLKPKELVTLGLPYLDCYAQNKKEKQCISTTKIVLIGSSWGNKGLLSCFGTAFIRQLALSGYDLIIRPHPQSLISETQAIQRYKTELGDLSNVSWDTQISPSQSMNRADILISDTSSLRFDFAFIHEKPVITLNIPKDAMPGYERDEMEFIWADLAAPRIGFVLEEQQLDELPKWIEKSFAEFDPETIRAFRDQTIANYARAGQSIAEFFISKIPPKVQEPCLAHS